MKIAIQGALGSFHHIAGVHYYGDSHDYICRDSFHDVFTALTSHTADTAIVAIENSLYGSINEVYDLLQVHRYPIVGEVVEHIHQNLITFPRTDLGRIKRIYSHPVALAQCAAFLETELPQAEIIEHHDTAAAVEFVKQRGDHTAAAIASTIAADMHDMVVLRPSIQDQRANFTRFLAIDPADGLPTGITTASKKPAGTTLAETDKASLILATSHKPGALYEALGVFADLGCNLTKLQSRPIRGKAWHYQFYIDVSISPNQLAEATKQLAKQDSTVVNLGTYRSAETTYED